MDGLAIRARCTAEWCNVLETSVASCGRWVGKSDRGGLESSRVVDSGDSSVFPARSGGSRSRRSSNGAGSCPAVLVACFCGRGRPVVKDGAAACLVWRDCGFALNIASARRHCLAASSRYSFSS